MSDLFVAVGEASGDVLAGRVVAELLRRAPGLDVAGMVGDAGRNAGVRVVVEPPPGAVGPLEVLRVAPRAWRASRALARALAAERPRVLLTVDAPALLLPLARRAKVRGLRVVHLVSPQVWAWRAGRIPRVAASVDEVLCLLPFEPEWWRGSVAARFVGHPLAIPSAMPRDPSTYLLLPGSRAGEIERLWPVARRVARRLHEVRPGCRVVAVASPSARLPAGDGVDDVVSGIERAPPCAAALTCSGTVTLELAARDIPMVVMYALNPLSYAVARRLVAVRHVSLPNLVAGRPLVPEHVQALDVESLVADLLSVADARPDYSAVLSALAGEYAVARIADAVAEALGVGPPGLEPGTLRV